MTRDRVFQAMEQAELDVLVLGRRDSVAYATGARSLWTAGTRPFGAACVLVAANRSTHLLSTWDAGVPPDVPFGNLYGVTWNPAVMAQSLRAITGLAQARRIGVDAFSPGFERAVPRLAPGAELVPADDLLQAIRAVKLPAEIERIGAAVAVAEEAVEAARAALADGCPADEALAAALTAAAARGVTVPASAPVVEATQIDLGFLVEGYEGGVGRAVDGSRAELQALAAAQRRLLDACRPAATAYHLRAAAAGTTHWMVRGCGMGFEPPVISASLGDTAVLQAGMVVSVEVEMAGRRRRDVAQIGARGPEIF